MKTKAIHFFIGIVVFTLVLSCKSEENDIPYTFNNVELCVNEQYKIPNGEDFEWQIINPKIATIEKNTIYAKSIGFTQVVAKNSTYFFNLSVKPTMLFEQPCLNWNSSREDVKNYMREYSIIDESKNEIAYEGMNKELQISYFFDNDKYSSVIVFIDRTSVSWDVFLNHMCYYYNIIETEDDEDDSENMYFTTQDHNTLITCTFVYYNSYSLCMIRFQPINYRPTDNN